MNRSILNAVFGEADKVLFKSIAKRLGVLEKNISENSDAPAPLTNITYDQLTDAIIGSTLTPGAKYLITDYQTVHTIPNTEDTNTGDIEPLLVTAISANELAPEAYSALFPADVIYYSPTNDQEMVPGCTKGYIYRRVDTKQNNDIPFDFRQVKFRRWQVSQPTWDGVTTYAKGIVVKSTIDNTLWLSLVNNNLNNATSDTTYWRQFEWDNLSYVSPYKGQWNITEGSFQSILTCTALYQDYKMWAVATDYNSAYSNKLESPLDSLISLSNSVIFGAGFYYNSIGVSFYYNTIGANFQSNTIGAYFQSNSIGAYFNSISIGAYFQSNSIGAGFSGKDLTAVVELYGKWYPHEVIPAVSGYVITWYDRVGAQQIQFIA